MSEQSNRVVIQKAFQRLLTNRDIIIKEGMVRLAKAGLEYLIRAHDEHSMFMAHTTETDTLAWAVANNGTVVASGSHDGGEGSMPGSAERTASDLLSSTTGWVAIILSEMEGYYRVDYEQDFLFDTSFNTASEFHTYFKRVN